jgi:two-component system response regulator
MNVNEIEIVLVEDDPNDAEMTIRALRKSNVANRIVHLRDGAGALDFFFGEAGQAKVHIPRVVLLDLKMPKVDGKEVLRKLKSDARTRTIPVVVLTSSKEDPDVRACYELGVNSYIVKPVGFGDFSKTISDLGVYWMLLNQGT